MEELVKILMVILCIIVCSAVGLALITITAYSYQIFDEICNKLTQRAKKIIAKHFED